MSPVMSRALRPFEIADHIPLPGYVAGCVRLSAGLFAPSHVPMLKLSYTLSMGTVYFSTPAKFSAKWRIVRASVHFAAAKQFADSIEAQSPSIKFPQLGMVTRFGVAPKSALAG